MAIKFIVLAAVLCVMSCNPLSKADLVHPDNLEKCLNGLKEQIAKVEVPASFKTISDSVTSSMAKKKSISMPSVFQENGSKVVSYIEGLSAEQKKSIRQEAEKFFDASIDLKYEIVCDDEDFDEFIDVTSAEYKENVASNKEIDQYFGYVALSRLIMKFIGE